MTPRSQRRAAERKARKAERKKWSTQTPAKPFMSIESASADLPNPIHLSEPISEAQLAANRENAKFSTGPITPEGKAISARNHFRHGLKQLEGDPVLLDSESKEDYARSFAAYQPSGSLLLPPNKNSSNA